MPLSRFARLAAAAIALVAWVGLVAQFTASLAQAGSALAAAWAMLRYFTIIANLAAAIVLTGVAAGRRPSPHLLGGIMLAILLVGIVYAVLLNGLLSLRGGAALADTLLHKVTPVLIPAWWLAFAPKGGLGARDPWAWAIPPLVYFGYALGRAAIDGHYPYPFMDVARIGWSATALHALIIAAGFVATGLVLVRIDHGLARRR